MSANKQFIAPLPIRLSAGSALEDVGRRLHERAASIGAERRGFLDWLQGRIGSRVVELPGSTALRSYDEQTLDGLLVVLRRSESRLSASVGSRAFREEMGRELAASMDRLSPLRAALAADEDEAEAAVLDLYGMDQAQRALVARDYA